MDKVEQKVDPKNTAAVRGGWSRTFRTNFKSRQNRKFAC